MNEQDPTPPVPPTPQAPPVPPQIPPQFIQPSAPPLLQPARRPLGDDPNERVAIPHIWAAIDAILRHPRRVMYQVRQTGAGRLIVSMVLAAVVCSVIYGVVAGTFSGGPQLWIAPAKIAMGLMISALICLPSLYIFTCLSGSQARLAELCGLLAGLLMLMTILLIGFAPVAWLFSQSTDSSVWMGGLHLGFWFIATFFGLRFLETGFTLSNARSHAGFYTWVIVFLLVAVQMTTALRPIISPSPTGAFLPTEKKFFMVYWSECMGGRDWETKPSK